MNPRRGWPALVLAALGLGCSIAPRQFADLRDPAPLVRARAAHLNGAVPDSVAIPALLERLNDPDPVVRLSAHEALRQRTGLDLGYRPWASPAARAQGVARWRSWWNGRSVAAARTPARRSAGLVRRRRMP